jgi:hypothetical protein
LLGLGLCEQSMLQSMSCPKHWPSFSSWVNANSQCCSRCRAPKNGPSFSFWVNAKSMLQSMPCPKKLTELQLLCRRF